MRNHKKRKHDEADESAALFCIMASVVMIGTISFHLIFGYVW